MVPGRPRRRCGRGEPQWKPEMLLRAPIIGAAKAARARARARTHGCPDACTLTQTLTHTHSTHTLSLTHSHTNTLSTAHAHAQHTHTQHTHTHTAHAHSTHTARGTSADDTPGGRCRRRPCCRRSRARNRPSACAKQTHKHAREWMPTATVYASVPAHVCLALEAVRSLFGSTGGGRCTAPDQEAHAGRLPTA